MTPIELGTLKMYTVEELADKLMVSTHTIYEYIKDGRLQARHFGKKYLITQESLEQYFRTPEA
jgi:excisionase family DNA binding protein